MSMPEQHPIFQYQFHPGFMWELKQFFSQSIHPKTVSKLML